jgi:glutamate-1-semialdehyde 2,1-aminomutase
MFNIAFTNLQIAKDYRDTLTFDKAKLGKFIAAMHDRKVRVIGRGLWYISAAHTDEDIDHGITVSAEVFATM